MLIVSSKFVSSNDDENDDDSAHKHHHAKLDCQTVRPGNLPGPPHLSSFYKPVVVRDPAVVTAIKEMMERGQPYLGAFLLKDENTDNDVIVDSVHLVGVFAQITSMSSANKDNDNESNGCFGSSQADKGHGI